jgi:hypothetical protein
MSKAFYGLSTLVDIFYDFNNKYCVIRNDQKYLKENWHEIKDDTINKYYSRYIINPLKNFADGLFLPNLLPIV